MYKVLVTTRGVTNSYQIRTNIVEFETTAEAITAADIINSQPQASYLQQKALPLFVYARAPTDAEQVCTSGS